MSANAPLVVAIGTLIETDLSSERELLEPDGARVVDARQLGAEKPGELLPEASAVTEGFFDFDFAAMPAAGRSASTRSASTPWTCRARARPALR